MISSITIDIAEDVVQISKFSHQVRLGIGFHYQEDSYINADWSIVLYRQFSNNMLIFTAYYPV